MRLWSLHPRYLDAKGLVALWREGLLAQAVLANKTKGYRTHPQLERFRTQPDPVRAIGVYLHYVCDEAELRGYEFDRRRILKGNSRIAAKSMTVTRGQLKHEWDHLLTKLKQRNREHFLGISQVKIAQAHPAMRVRAGGVETWERVGDSLSRARHA